MSDPPSLQELKEVLSYDPKTGHFTWIQGRCAGLRAGYIRPNMYVQLKFKKKTYLAHRIAWLYMTGSMSKFDIDHIDHDKTNNIFTNLREVTRSENCQNVKRKGTRKKNNGYDARIMVGGKSTYLGYFPTEEEAREAYLNAKKKLHLVASQNCFKG